MADTSLFSRLQRLFSTNVIVRNVGGKRLKVSDTSRTQSIAKNNLIDRNVPMHLPKSRPSLILLTWAMRNPKNARKVKAPTKLIA